MSDPKQPSSVWVDHFFRHEAGKIVSLLTKIFGIQNLQLAEDVVQDTLITALNEWSFGALPDNPSAWVMTVARRKLLNFLRRDKLPGQHVREIILRQYSESDLDEIFREAQVEDSVLRMVFVCCHPSLATEAQIMITLKILCGFSAQEIANALLSNESAVNKRLFRTKQEFKSKNLPLEIPEGEALEERLKSVYTCIYLLFNEGYNSSHPDFLIRKDLCAEAMRLCMLILQHFPKQHTAAALMALMCFHAARFDSRIDDQGALVIFSRQDRSRWNAEFIGRGHFFLAEAAHGELLSEYHVEAAIAAEHCTAGDFVATNWKAIDGYYAVLGRMKDNPIIDLNRAVILSQTQGPLPAIGKLLTLLDHPRLKGYYLLHATLGELYSQAGNPALARGYFLAACALTPSKTEQVFLREKIDQLPA
jgi:RNA polymerase sigma factor (sigma-70 family)